MTSSASCSVLSKRATNRITSPPRRPNGSPVAASRLMAEAGRLTKTRLNQLSQRTGAKLKWFGLTDDGRLDLSDVERVITEKTKIVSFVLVSNILGTVTTWNKGPAFGPHW